MLVFQIVAADNSKPGKIDILIGWVRQQFVPFSSDAWLALKESSFTSAFSKFAVLKSEVAAEVCDEIV